MEEKKYSETDLQAAHQIGLRLWLEQNAFRLFILFGLGLVTGFLLAYSLFSKPVCGA